jgi:hypothetical protein
MKEFVLIFRMDELPEVKLTPEELTLTMQVWEKWMDKIIADNILVSRGNRLGSEAKTVKRRNVVINGPYTETREIVGGYIIIQAKNIEAAVEIVKGCPAIIDGRLSAEIRNVYTGDN